MGSVHAIFKADGDETRGRYAISEWWLEPYTRGPGAHTHDDGSARVRPRRPHGKRATQRVGPHETASLNGRCATSMRAPVQRGAAP